MNLNGVEISDEEWKVLSKILPMVRAHIAKIVHKVTGTATSAKIYVPKEWGGDRVIILSLKKHR